MKAAKIVSAMLLGGLISTGAYATNGYFASGYGIQSQGMGGVSIAFPQDSLAAASNPASIGFLGDRLDVGVTYFQPNRSATIGGGNTNAMNGTFDGNGTKAFWIPEFGVTKSINKEFSVGLNVYGNGGMNTSYSQPIFGQNYANQTGVASTNSGINLEQMFISPTVSWKPVESQSLGVSLIYVNQTISATGLQNFTFTAPPYPLSYQSSQTPGNVTDKGNSTSTGFGYQLGWLGKITNDLSLGIRYQPKISMSTFGSYSGLFANGGSFDIPETYGAGFAYKITSDLTFAGDYQNIKYGNVPSIANPVSNMNAGGNGLLGGSNGAGFGWQNINVYKLGANWRINPSWAVRVGYNFNDQPIPNSQTFFNVLAPGVITQQASIGATYYLGKEYEISGFYAHGFKQTVSGPIASQQGGGNSSLSMYQDSVGLGFGWKF
jgi:long-chain fatty acid transport protein